jgi:hypothetical protein
MKQATFSSYEEYVQVQQETNQRKLDRVYVTAKELGVVAEHIKKYIPTATFGICHGARNGYEVKFLRDKLSIEVIGTDISETATQFAHMIQWDFHELKPEWVGNVDFIYSNSWDHSYDFPLALQRWMQCLNPSGRLFLHHSNRHTAEYVGGADCFGATLDELSNLVRQHYEVEHIYSLRGNLVQRLSRSYQDVHLVVVKQSRKTAGASVSN